MLRLALLALFFISTTSAQEDTVALIVGGYWRGPGPTRVLGSVEVFGCASAKGQSVRVDSREIQSHPDRLYLPAARWIENSDSLLLCGGYRCQSDQPRCQISNDCETWSPERGWAPHSNLTMPRWAQIMVEASNINKTSNEKVPLVLGLNRDTEIYDPESNSWQEYLNLGESYWYSLGCLFEHEGKVWGLRNKIYMLDLETWDLTDFGEVPPVHKNPGKCAPVEINGELGIMTRYGFWYNTVTRTWHQKAYPPTNLREPAANAMFSFRNKPTIFGNVLCDGDGENCQNSQVAQYQPDTDEWIVLGEFLQPRLFHEVIEVPASVCDSLATHGPFEDTAALVIGGYSRYSQDPILDSVELFGCPGTGQESVSLTNYPKPTYLSAGGYMHSMVEPGRLLSCGGYSCNVLNTSSSCSVTDKCYSWDPKSDTWTEDSTLPMIKWAHLFAFGPNLNKTDSDGPVEPILLGNTRFTYIYDSSTNQWSNYRDIEGLGWYSIGCLTQYKGKIYVIRENLYVMDPYSWTMVDMGEVPGAHKMPGRCSVVQIDNEDGIMTRHGYWYNLHRGQWEMKRSPPLPQQDIAPTPNSMHSFRGKPTMFGVPVCNGNVTECPFKAVIQYDPDMNKWIKLGDLIQPRAFHDVIEIPRKWCDYIVPTTTSTTTTTTTTTTTKTTTSTTTTTTTTTTTKTTKKTTFTTTSSTTTEQIKTTTTGTSTTTSSASTPIKSYILLACIGVKILYHSFL